MSQIIQLLSQLREIINVYFMLLYFDDSCSPRLLRIIIFA